MGNMGTFAYIKKKKTGHVYKLLVSCCFFKIFFNSVFELFELKNVRVNFTYTFSNYQR